MSTTADLGGREVAHQALFAAARDLLAVRDGDGRSRAERVLDDPRRGCGCAHAAAPCRACRTLIALATEVAGARVTVVVPAPRAACDAAGLPVVSPRAVVRRHRARTGVAS